MRTADVREDDLALRGQDGVGESGPELSLPLTIGTAGHVDHGKTALVAALTGVDTDRLPEEKARGLTIVLGYAPLHLPGGRRMSLIDVPGHERFVRTMVAGATGVDMFLMVVAADDGVMPQTVEHARVLRALGVRSGVVAVTKCDLADPEPASQGAATLLPGCRTVACSAASGEGMGELLSALDDVAARTQSRALAPRAARLHIDRVFSVAGRGTVVTGTLWSGTISRGEVLELLPGAKRVRVRGLEVHDVPLARVSAGQRVAVNLLGVRPRELARGDALAAAGSLHETRVLDCALELDGARHGQRVQVHHGTRAVPGRLVLLDAGLWQLRLEQPLLALSGDRVVVRGVSPSDTLGGGRVLDALAHRHGRRPELISRLRALQAGEPIEDVRVGAAAQPAGADLRLAPADDEPRSVRPRAARDEALQEALEQRLRQAGTALLSEAQMENQRLQLRSLREAGRAVRLSGRLYAHADVVDLLRRRIVELIERDGPVTLGEVRDRLGISRKSAQAFLEHLDRERLTRRLADDRRVLTGLREDGRASR